MRGRSLLAAASAGVASWGCAHLASRLPGAWERSSFTGATVNLVEGAVALSGLAAASLVNPAPTALTVAVSSAGSAGILDDHFEEVFPAKGKGLSGHLGALREGKLTTGALKIVLIGSGAAISAALMGRDELVKDSSPTRKVGSRLLTWGERTALIAGSANLINLLDLRPGRALKVSALFALALLASGEASARSAASGVLATSAVCAPGDLSGRTMLGDTGANALGAALGFGFATRPLPRRIALGLVVALTLASERVSFSAVIEKTPALAWLDSLGRS